MAEPKEADIQTLLDIMEGTRGLPRLKVIHDRAIRALEKIAAEMEEEDIVERQKAKEEAEAKAVEEELARQAEKEKADANA